MNKSIKFAMSMVTILSVTTAYAVKSGVTGVREGIGSSKTQKEKDKEKDKVKAAESAKNSGAKQADLESRYADILDGGLGADAAHILGLKLENVVRVQGKDGTTVTFEAKVETNEIAEFILTKMAKEVNGEIKVQLKKVAHFMAMAKNLSMSNNQEYGAFVKQVALIPEMFTTMSAAERATHISVMDRALAKVKENPEMKGDIAYSLALKELYGKDYAQKLLDILGCLQKG